MAVAVTYLQQWGLPFQKGKTACRTKGNNPYRKSFRQDECIEPISFHRCENAEYNSQSNNLESSVCMTNLVADNTALELMPTAP
jgi:hypothetical protein